MSAPILAGRSAARRTRRATAGVLLATGAGVLAGVYLAQAGLAWARYGRHHQPTRPAGEDRLLDSLMPRFDVVERHHIRVAAPVDVTFRTALDIDLSASALARAIFRAREWIMGSASTGARASAGFVADMLALGWGRLAEEPGREIVMGGVTKPWEADPTFRAIPPDRFADFNEPGLVKIAFTLRADPIGTGHSVFRTETRAIATDAAARRLFRTYWAFLSPGIVLIRLALLRPLKAEAERRFHAAR